MLQGADIVQNDHQWGDQWNGEDLSIYSGDDLELPTAAHLPSHNPHSPAYSENQSSREEQEVEPHNLKHALKSPSITSDPSQPQKQGYRAAEAYIRPSPIYVNGRLVHHVFDLKNCTFTMSLTAKVAAAPDAPTEIYLPEFHFPEASTVVAVSGGKWEIDCQEIQSFKIQCLRWWHADGEQDIKVEGVKHKPGEFANLEEITYLEHCQRGPCVMM